MRRTKQWSVCSAKAALAQQIAPRLMAELEHLRADLVRARANAF